jgi:hypothetical protein
MPRKQPPLVLNHYLIQSRERFAAVKMTRGDVNRPGFEQLRTVQYFNKYDKEGNKTDNFELRDLVLCYRYNCTVEGYTQAQLTSSAVWKIASESRMQIDVSDRGRERNSTSVMRMGRVLIL